MQKWEYTTVGFTGSFNVDKLDELGREGWELVTLLPVGGLVESAYFIFKRPKP
ncbi:MAG: hypothetical protein ACRELY_21650 [Polyangiaceae bacterium]